MCMYTHTDMCRNKTHRAGAVICVKFVSIHCTQCNTYHILIHTITHKYMYKHQSTNALTNIHTYIHISIHTHGHTQTHIRV